MLDDDEIAFWTKTFHRSHHGSHMEMLARVSALSSQNHPTPDCQPEPQSKKQPKNKKVRRDKYDDGMMSIF